MRRSAGVLVHVTSLPGPFGVGDLGPIAHRWIDTLARARQQWWQVLPLVPTGHGHSPYAGTSAMAGNPLLISPELLVKDDLLNRRDIPTIKFSAERVDYDRAEKLKRSLIDRAWENFRSAGERRMVDRFRDFCESEKAWLDDHALFTALKEAQGGVDWSHWPRDLVRRKATALKSARRELADAVERHSFAQFLFARQMNALRDHAHEKNVKLIGDLPIFVAYDSSDVWANSNQFKLDKHHQPTVVAGVPPDYFCKTGQRWGNPHYNWKVMEADGFRWWVDRVKATLRQVDLVRLDHFRGFDASWAVPASCPTAVEGRWAPVPGAELFKTFRKKIGGLPFIAEDLGLITPGVEKLRDDFQLPGMRVLQFAFGGGSGNTFLPHHYPHNSVAYTGTHDNDTTVGWFRSLKAAEKKAVFEYVPEARKDVAKALTRLAWSSVADVAITPLQDVLNLGTAARMNVPGKAAGNWGWRATEAQIHPDRFDTLADFTETYGRGPST